MTKELMNKLGESKLSDMEFEAILKECNEIFGECEVKEKTIWSDELHQYMYVYDCIILKEETPVGEYVSHVHIDRQGQISTWTDVFGVSRNIQNDVDVRDLYDEDYPIACKALEVIPNLEVLNSVEIITRYEL